MMFPCHVPFVHILVHRGFIILLTVGVVSFTVYFFSCSPFRCLSHAFSHSKQKASIASKRASIVSKKAPAVSRRDPIVSKKDPQNNCKEEAQL